MSALVAEIVRWLNAEDSRNHWFTDGEVTVYVRKAKRRPGIGEPFVDCLDLANVVVEHQGQGNFTHFILELERTCPRPIFVENVLNTRFRGFWERRGYYQDPYKEDCFWSPRA